MEHALPDWICNEFFAQCLQEEEGKPDIVVTRFTSSAAAPPGNNYGSFIIRVKVEYKNNIGDHEVHFKYVVLKSELTHGAIKENFDHLNELQASEYDFYYKFLPKAEKLTDTAFVAKSYFSPKQDVVILEDLKEEGFTMADRLKQLDFEHCRLYMIAAASMHAASFAVHKEEPKLIESMGKEKMFSNGAKCCDLFVPMIRGGLKCFVDAIEKIESFKKYSKVVNDVTPLMWDMLVESHKPSEAINTFNQGDPWTTNVMFKYDKDGNVSDIKLIDFQCLRYSSPINDLVFFIWSSANNDVKSHRLNELYRIYLEAFNSKLEQLHCAERLTLDQLIINLKKLSPLALFQVACMLPLLLNPDPVDFGVFFCKDSENSEENIETAYKQYYNEKFCKEYIPCSVEQLEKAGAFECLEKCIYNN